MKIILTGSQGFIGSYLCQHLLDLEHEVVGVDNFSKYGRVSRPHDQHPQFRLMEFDIAKEPGQLASLVKIVAPDYLVAGAAMIGGISYFHNFAYDLLATNERITANTFDAAIGGYRCGRLRRIIVLSSSMVFESTDRYPTREIDLLDCPPPQSTYGFQKLATEYFAKGAFEQYGLPYTILRPFNCIGVGENEAVVDKTVLAGNIKLLMSHVVPDLIFKALQLGPHDPLPILGGGEQVRHYTDGRDIARGIAMAMFSSAGRNQDFNISSNRTATVKELATIIWNKIHGCNPTFQFCEPYRYDVQVRSPNTNKALDQLGFEATIGLEDSLDVVIEWMREQYPALGADRSCDR